MKIFKFQVKFESPGSLYHVTLNWHGQDFFYNGLILGDWYYFRSNLPKYQGLIPWRGLYQVFHDCFARSVVYESDKSHVV